MQDDQYKPRSDFRWGIPVSVVAHLLVAAILIVGLPLELPTPPEEETVTVEIVEPPPEPEPEPEPESEPAEQEPAGEPPPPPPVEEDQAPEPPAEEEAAAAPPIPTLRPVFEFGEETTGPRVSPEGNSSEEGAEGPQEQEQEDQASQTPPPEAPEELAAEPQDDAEVAGLTTAPPEASAEAAETPEQPAEEPAETLAEARTLFSPDITEDPVARTAMEGMPRAMRATQLCETELTEQLRNASPPQDPDFIPRSPLSEGTVLELRRTAFRAEGAWYDLSFRCQIDDDATKVLSFAFRIGAPVPRSEWRRRGFPGS
ncbi:hypothetical protein RHAB21_02802 [Pseudorhizobium halotolerans]|uniref:DUF930 domain-containing protein n=2 Tax=Pseudorhizobium halotolerans TaxID=1233081 RepID=A0ABN7JMJ4_9HYPH|nr:hypothetical protein RHAB21_02802 [Pseudorhizobium halotolerans]